MVPVGYMAKRVYKKADWLAVCKKKVFLENAPQVVDIYSVSGCISENFADYIRFWKHNGYWLFDSAEIITSVARENSLQLEGTALFYYEGYEMEFDGECWSPWSPEPSFPTNIIHLLRCNFRASTSSVLTSEPTQNVLPSRAMVWRRRFIQILTVCSNPLTRQRRVSAMAHLRTLSPASTEYSRSIL
jgi:hypothetical protein